MKITAVAAAAAFIISGSAWAQASGEASAMPECTGPCSYQVIGDTSDAVDNSTSSVKQLNPSSASNVSSGAIEADQRLQMSENRLGDATATGGSASGNRTDLDASSKASNGNMTGLGGSAVTGDSKATIGDTNANSRADSRVDNNNHVAGGAGGGGGAGGSGIAAQGQAQKVTDSGNAAQAQGIKDSGNAAQDQGQGQDQGQAQRSNQGQGQSAEIDASDSSRLDVDASDRSSHETTIDATVRYYPPVIHQAPSQLATANMAVTVGPCGPLTDKTREQVLGVFHGYFGQNQVGLGWDEDLVAVTDPETGLPGYYAQVRQRDGSIRLFGNQVTTTHAVIGVAGGRSLSLFGAGRSSAGEAGMSGNSSMQRVVLRHTIQVCDAGTIKYELPVVERVRQ